MKRIKVASTFLAFLTLTANSIPVAYSQDSSVTLKITNQTGQAADVFWVRPDGSEVKYGHLDPGQAYDQGTYSGHGWRAKGPSGNILGNFVAPSGGGAWAITGASAAPPAPYTGPVGTGLKVQRSISELGTPEVTAAFYYNGIAYLFNGNLCIAYDLAKQAPNPGGPKSAKELWGHEYNVDGAFLGPNPGEVTFNYNAAGDLYYCVYPVVGQGPATKFGASGKATAQFPGSIGTPTASLELPTGEILRFNKDVGMGSDLQIVNLATKTANEQFKDANGRYGLPTIASKFPGIPRIDAAFYVPESKEAYLFGGKYLWIYNFDAKDFVTAGSPIESSLPKIAFKAGAAPIALAPTTMDDLQGMWEDPTGLKYVIAQIDGGYKLRFVQTLAQGIDSLKGSQADRENARREFPTQLVGTSPQAMTSRDSSNGDTQYKLLNPNTLEIRFPSGGGVYDTRVFAKKSGVAQITAQGATFDDTKPVTLTIQGHPALALTSGTVEFSFKPGAPSGPLFGATGRFYMDYDANGLSTFNGRINAPVKIGDWNHLILSSDGFVTNVALNGQPVGSLSDGLYMGNEQRITFGARDNTPYKGEMKNIRIWDAAIPLDVLYGAAGKTLAGTSDLRADLKQFLLAEDGKIVKSPNEWEKELKGDKAVYVVAYETVKVGSDPLRAQDRRAAISLGQGATANDSAYVTADASGSQDQMFVIRQVAGVPGYYEIVNSETSTPAAVADAVQRFEYGKLVFQANGTTTNTRLVVDGRHLAAGSSKTRDPRYGQFRFVRQAVLNNGQLELAWIIQPRAAAESIEATKSAFTPYGSFQVQDSLSNEIIQLDKADGQLGHYGAVKCSPYVVSEPKRRIFTLFPANLSASRPKAIKFDNLGKSIKELEARRDAFKAKPTAEKFSRLWFVAPPTNDPTGNVAPLMQEFNKYYATIGTTNAMASASGARSFEEDFLRPVPSGAQSESGSLDTQSLGRSVSAAMARFKADPKTKAQFPNATDNDFLILESTLTDRLNNRSKLETLITEYREESLKLKIDDVSLRQELQTLFQVTPQADIEIIRRQDPEKFFGWENGLSLLGLGFDGAGLGDEGLGDALEIVSFFIDIAMLEKQIIEFSLSQLEENETVKAYSNGDAEAADLNSTLALAGDAATAIRERLFGELAEICLYDPTLLEEIASKQTRLESGKAKKYAEAQALRKKETRKAMLARMLPVYGAIIGINRDTKFATSPAATQTQSGMYALDNMYNDLEHYAAPGPMYGQLDRSNFVAATMSKSGDKEEYFSWHLVKRPASSKYRVLSPTIMTETRANFPNPRNLMNVMASSTYVQGYDYTNPITGDVQGQINGAVGSGDGEGIWLPVPKGFIGMPVASSGNSYRGRNTGHENIDKITFVHNPSELTLFYWPQPKRIFNNSNVVAGVPLPPEEAKPASREAGGWSKQNELERRRRQQ